MQSSWPTPQSWAAPTSWQAPRRSWGDEPPGKKLRHDGSAADSFSAVTSRSEQSWTPQSAGSFSVSDQLKRNSLSVKERIADQKAGWNQKAKEDQQNDLPAIDWASQPRNPFRRDFLPYGCADILLARSLRQQLGLVIEQDPSGEGLTPMPIRDFHEISALPQWVAKALADNKWESPTAIQSQALPIALAGKDVIGIAQTGSGKTAAFLLPGLIHIDAQRPLTAHEPGPVALVLAPTRELAVQISDEAKKLLWHSAESGTHPGGMRSVVLYGGGSKYEQLRECTSAGTHVLVATPGRLIDCLAAGSVSLHRVTYLVLDEADRMLDMGFAGDVRNITSQVRPERQTMFFSATWSADVQSLAVDFCSQDPVRIRAGQVGAPGAPAREVGVADSRGQGDAVPDDVLSVRDGITQQVVVLDGGDWQEREVEKRKMLEAHIQQCLSSSPHNKVLVFVNEKGFVDELVDKLWKQGIHGDAIHGGRKQHQRLRALEQFRSGDLRLLVATDVLGRGIDIPDISHVVVYNMGAIDNYVHRIGRTARGKDATGHALVFFEYYWKEPEVAEKFVDLLQSCRQPVPPELVRISQEVAAGKRDICDEWGKKILVGRTCSKEGAAWAQKAQWEKQW